jgi:Na+/H+ antiporter NhaD/arsenite permease-like protein
MQTATLTVSPDQRPVVLAVFVLTYLGLAIGRIPGLKLNRTGIAVLGAIAMMIVSRNSTSTVVSCVNWPTIFLLFGFFVISAQLRLSGFFDRVAENIAARLSSPARFLVFLIAVTAGLSAFLNNDIVCYVLAPVVGTALVRKNMNPVPFLIALAAASNIGAGATLIGNAQNMMIGELAGLGFLRYMLWSIVPVTVGLATIYMVTRLGAGNRPPAPLAGAEPEAPSYPFDFYHLTKGLVVLAAVIALFFTSLPREVVVLLAAGIHLMSTKFRTEDLLALVDWPVLLLFTALFVVSGTFQATGYGTELVQWLEGLGLDPNRPAVEVAVTAGLTALINNAPAVMLLVKLVPITQVSTAYIMAVANSFGGNAILTASVANLIVVQQARRQGIIISFGQFARLGIPITLVSLGGLIGWALLMGKGG